MTPKTEAKFSVGEEVVYIGVDRPDLRNTVMIITEAMYSNLMVHKHTEMPFNGWFYKTNYHTEENGYSQESDFRKVSFDKEENKDVEVVRIEGTITI